MSCPTPSDFQNLVVDPNSAACDQLRKLGLLAEMVADAYECIYNEDGSLSQTFIDKLCATGCGGGTTSTTTTSGGGTGEQLYSSAGSYEFTVPGGVTLMTLTAVGGGGGGGGLNIPFSPVPCFDGGPSDGVASGGGSGEKRSGSFAVTPGEVLTIVVGGGGGQVNPTRQGSAGSPSYVLNGALTTLISANGGSGGAWGCCGSGPFSGGAGGSGGSGGTSTSGNAGGATTASPGCANGSGGASVALSAGAGSSGIPASLAQHPGSDGAVRLTW